MTYHKPTKALGVPQGSAPRSPFGSVYDRNTTIGVDLVLNAQVTRPIFGGVVRDYVAEELQQETEKSLAHRSYQPRYRGEVN